jgi:LPXTG-motif cell wall-anchored protein
MGSGRKTAMWMSSAAAVFVIGTAIYTGNAALFILGGLCVVLGLGLGARKRRR